MSDTHDQKLGHADDADGIEEYDNPLPDWWLGLFFATVVFAMLYPVWHHMLSVNTQLGAYEYEMAKAEERWPGGASAGPLKSDPETLAAGEEIFAQTCASCHQADLSGGIGPNLVDDTWIHGGEPNQVVGTITNGVADKGMPAWGPILGPKKVSQVAAYVVSQRTTQ